MEDAAETLPRPPEGDDDRPFSSRELAERMSGRPGRTDEDDGGPPDPTEENHGAEEDGLNAEEDDALQEAIAGMARTGPPAPGRESMRDRMNRLRDDESGGGGEGAAAEMRNGRQVESAPRSSMEGKQSSAEQKKASKKQKKASAIPLAGFFSSSMIDPKNRKVYPIESNHWPLKTLPTVIKSPDIYNCICHTIPITALKPGTVCLEFNEKTEDGKIHQEIAHVFAFLAETFRLMENARNKVLENSEAYAPQRGSMYCPAVYTTMEVCLKKEVQRFDLQVTNPDPALLASASSSSSAAAAAAPAEEEEEKIDDAEGGDTATVAGTRKKKRLSLRPDRAEIDSIRIFLFYKDPDRAQQPNTGASYLSGLPMDDTTPGVLGTALKAHFDRLEKEQQKEAERSARAAPQGSGGAGKRGRPMLKSLRNQSPIYRVTFDRFIALCAYYAKDPSIQMRKNDIRRYPLDSPADGALDVARVFSAEYGIATRGGVVLSIQGAYPNYVEMVANQPRLGMFPFPMLVWNLSTFSQRALLENILPCFEDDDLKGDDADRQRIGTEIRAMSAKILADRIARFLLTDREGGSERKDGRNTDAPSEANVFEAVSAMRMTMEEYVAREAAKERDDQGMQLGSHVQHVTSDEELAARYLVVKARGEAWVKRYIDHQSKHLSRSHFYVRIKENEIKTLDQLREHNIGARAEIERVVEAETRRIQRKYKESNAGNLPDPFTKEADRIDQEVHKIRAALLSRFKLEAFANFDRIAWQGAGDLSLYSEKIREWLHSQLDPVKRPNFYRPKNLMFADLSPFGNMFAAWKIALDIGAKFGHTHADYIRFFMSALHTYYGDPFNFNIFFHGDQAVGKSYVVKMVKAAMIKDTVEELQHQSAQAESASGNRDDAIEFFEETPPDFLSGAGGKGGKNSGSNGNKLEEMVKGRMTSGTNTVKVCEIDPQTGERKSKIYRAQCKATIWLLSNQPRVAMSGPLQSRMCRVLAEGHPGIDNKTLLKSQKTAVGIQFNNYVRDCTQNSRIMQGLVWMIMKLVYTNCLADIDISMCEKILHWVLQAAGSSGLTDSADIRSKDRITMLARVAVVLDAYDKFFRQTMRKDTQKPFKVFDLIDIEPYLCCTLEHTVFVITLLELQYEDPLVNRIRLELRSRFEQDINKTYLYCHPEDCTNLELVQIPFNRPKNSTAMPIDSLARQIAAKFRGTVNKDEILRVLHVITQTTLTIAPKRGTDKEEKEKAAVKAAMKAKRQQDRADAKAKRDKKRERELKMRRLEREEAIAEDRSYEEKNDDADYKDAEAEIEEEADEEERVAELEDSSERPTIVQALDVHDNHIILAREWVFGNYPEGRFVDALRHLWRLLRVAEYEQVYLSGMPPNDHIPHLFQVIKFAPPNAVAEAEMQAKGYFQMENSCPVPDYMQEMIARESGRLFADDYNPDIDLYDVRKIGEAGDGVVFDDSIDEYFIKRFLLRAGWTIDMIQKRGVVHVSPYLSRAAWARYYSIHADEAPPYSYYDLVRDSLKAKNVEMPDIAVRPESCVPAQHACLPRATKRVRYDTAAKEARKLANREVNYYQMPKVRFIPDRNHPHYIQKRRENYSSVAFDNADLCWETDPNSEAVAAAAAAAAEAGEPE